jgi:hypothetical protein
MAQFSNVVGYANILTTALDGLGEGVASAASAVKNNDTDFHGVATVSLQTPTWNTGTNAGARVDVHMCKRCGDGSTFEDVGPSNRVRSFSIPTGNTAKNVAIANIELPHVDFVWRLVPRAGVTMPANGSVFAATYADVKPG